MIGEDMLKGYKEEKDKKKDSKEFCAAKKVAFERLGLDENGKKIVKSKTDVEEMQDRIVSLEHNILQLRQSNIDLINCFNEMQKGIVSKLDDIDNTIKDTVRDSIDSIKDDIRR